MRLNHNLASLNIYRENTKVLGSQSRALERISSGFKISGAKDNPVKIANSERMRMQIRGLEMAHRNVQDGISMLQTAEGGLTSIRDMIGRIRELTVQSGDGIASPQDKEAIQKEINQLIEGIDYTAKNTEFNGVKLLNGDGISSGSYDNKNPSKKLEMPVGAHSGEKVDIPVFDLSTKNLGDGVYSLQKLSTDLNTSGGLDNLGVDKALSIIDSAMSTTISATSKYGALENRFESTYNKISEIHDVTVGAESKIRDSDLAEEMIVFSRDNILNEAGNAMMVQANKFPQDVLRILENVKSR